MHQAIRGRELFQAQLSSNDLLVARAQRTSVRGGGGKRETSRSQSPGGNSRGAAGNRFRRGTLRFSRRSNRIRKIPDSRGVSSRRKQITCRLVEDVPKEMLPCKSLSCPPFFAPLSRRTSCLSDQPP